VAMFATSLALAMFISLVAMQLLKCKVSAIQLNKYTSGSKC